MEVELSRNNQKSTNCNSIHIPTQTANFRLGWLLFSETTAPLPKTNPKKRTKKRGEEERRRGGKGRRGERQNFLTLETKNGVVDHSFLHFYNAQLWMATQWATGCRTSYGLWKQIDQMRDLCRRGFDLWLFLLISVAIVDAEDTLWEFSRSN